MWGYLARSTLKREAASILMLWLVGVATYLIIVAPTWEQKLEVMNIFALPFMGIFTAAFGADFVAKQTNIAGPPQRDGDGPPRDGDHHDDGNPNQ